MLELMIFTETDILFKGQAKSVIFPGEMGVFEVLPFHKRMISRLIKGNIDVDGRLFPIFRGIMKIDKNQVHVVVEKTPPSSRYNSDPMK